MTVIDKSTVVVFTSDELKDALENNNGYEYIYFGSNITLTTGIAISSSKTSVVIDGKYDGVIHGFTDQKKLGVHDGIYVSNSKTSNVIVKKYGRNRV